MRTSVLAAAVMGIAGLAASASADVLAQIEVIAEDGSGNEIGRRAWVQNVTPGQQNGNLNWGSADGENNSAWELGSGVKVHGVAFHWDHDPLVNASFNVSSGPLNTTFTINSTFISFGAITPALGYATAFIGLTDSLTFGDVGSVTFTGLQAGGNAYQAHFNNSVANTYDGAAFANLITGGTYSGSTALVGQSPSYPLLDPLGFPVASMQSQFKFSLSRFDRAAGTSTFFVIPAPGAAALLGLGGLVAARRRRA